MNIITLIGYITIAAIMFSFFYLGYLYVKETKATYESNSEKLSFNKQAYVKKHRNVFGINDSESGNINHVYTVSPEKMGF